MTMPEDVSQRWLNAWPFRVGAAAIYAALAVSIYDALSWQWAYFGFVWGNPGLDHIFLGVALAALPAVFLPASVRNLHQFSAWMLQYAVFAPAILVPMLQQLQGPAVAVRLSAMISLCACIFAWLSKYRVKQFRSIKIFSFQRKHVLNAVIGVLSAAIIYLIVTHGTSLQVSSFNDVYDQRADFGSDASVLDGYLIPIMANVLIPFVFVTGINQRRIELIILSVVSIFIVYATFALKSQILSPILMAGVYFLFDKDREHFRVYIIPISLSIMSLFSIPFLNKYDPTGGTLELIATLIFMRTLLLPGVIVGMFATYFSMYPTTLYSHSLVGRYFVDYPYGDLSVGQIVGLYLIPQQGAVPFELNGGFIATDGLAALSLIGIPIAFLITAAALRVMTKAAMRVENRFLFPVTMPFLLTLANTSVFSSMVTGGGFALALLLYMWGMARRPEASGSESMAESMPDMALRAAE